MSIERKIASLESFQARLLDVNEKERGLLGSVTIRGKFKFSSGYKPLIKKLPNILKIINSLTDEEIRANQTVVNSILRFCKAITPRATNPTVEKIDKLLLSGRMLRVLNLICTYEYVHDHSSEPYAPRTSSSPKFPDENSSR